MPVAASAGSEGSRGWSSVAVPATIVSSPGLPSSGMMRLKTMDWDRMRPSRPTPCASRISTGTRLGCSSAGATILNWVRPVSFVPTA
ncbi:hypothetical protein ABIA16_005911 [Sinorhizobium fredii]